MFVQFLIGRFWSKWKYSVTLDDMIYEWSHSSINTSSFFYIYLILSLSLFDPQFLNVSAPAAPPNLTPSRTSPLHLRQWRFKVFSFSTMCYDQKERSKIVAPIRADWSNGGSCYAKDELERVYGYFRETSWDSLCSFRRWQSLCSLYAKMGMRKCPLRVIIYKFMISPLYIL